MDHLHLSNTVLEGEFLGTGDHFATAGPNSSPESTRYPGHYANCPDHLGPPDECWWCGTVANASSGYVYSSPRLTASVSYPAQAQQDPNGQEQQRKQQVQGWARPNEDLSSAVTQPAYSINTPPCLGGHIKPAIPTAAQPSPPPRAWTGGLERTYANAAQQLPPLGQAFPLPPSQGRASPISPRRTHSRLAEHHVVMRLSPDLNAEWHAGIQQQRREQGMSRAQWQQMIYTQQQAWLQGPMDLVLASPAQSHADARDGVTGNPRDPATWFEQTPNRIEHFNLRQQPPQGPVPTPDQRHHPIIPASSTRSRSSASGRRRLTPATPNRSFAPSLSTLPTQSTTSRTQRTISEMRNSTGPYQCTHEGCGYQCHTQASLNKHDKNKHTPYEDREHACHICGKRFVWGNHLRKHMLTHPENLSPESPSRQRFFCEYSECRRFSKYFLRKDHFVRHMQKHQSDSVTMSRSISSQTFRSG